MTPNTSRLLLQVLARALIKEPSLTIADVGSRQPSIPERPLGLPTALLGRTLVHSCIHHAKSRSRTLCAA
jgi:hypothetical protein